MIVADASLLANLLVHPQTDKGAQAVRLRDGEWMAPPFWRSEMHSALFKYIRARMLTIEESDLIMERAAQLLDGRESRATTRQILSIASSAGISVYDAEYVAVAKELRIPLITFDQKLIRAVPGIALSPEEFLL